MTETKEVYGYFGIRTDEDGKTMGFASSRELNEVQKMLGNFENIEEIAQHAKESNDVDEVKLESLEKTMNKIVESNRSKSELLFILSMLRPLYVITMTEKQIISPVKDSGDIVEKSNNIVIYALPEKIFRRLYLQRSRIERTEKGLAALPAALLMSIVATFDSNIADVIRDMLTLKAEFMQTGTKTISLIEVLQADSIQELKEKFVSDEIYQFSRGSHEDQVHYIENTFHVSIKEHWKRWPDFIEVFERRNLVAHGEKTFTQRYVSICKKHGHKGSEKTLGTQLELTIDYLQQAENLLLEFNILLILFLWKKHFPNEEQNAFKKINQVSFKIIESKNFIVAIRILDYSLNLRNAKILEGDRKMMIINLASAHRHMNDKQKCLDILNSVDWSGSSDDYKLCVSALKEEILDVINQMNFVVSSKKITKSNFREWPVFDFIRENEEFCTKYLQIFGESIHEGEKAKAVELQDSASTNSLPDDTITVH